MIDMYTVNKNNGSTMKLKNVKLNNDIYGYSLSLTYNIESLGEISELHIPRVSLPFKEHDLTITRSGYAYEDVSADVGFGMVRLMPGDAGAYFTTKVIKTKTKEMTLEEIEKKLGHKVKIVNK